MRYEVIKMCGSAWTSSGTKNICFSRFFHTKNRKNRPKTRGWWDVIPALGVGGVLRFSLGLLRTAYSPVMTMAQTASLVMDSYLVALYHMYDTDSFLGCYVSPLDCFGLTTHRL